MKKSLIIVAVLLCAGLTAFATVLPFENLTKVTADTTKNQSKKVAVQYTCPMHADVISGKPGKCPKCGMTLVKKVPAKKKA